jgi:hypothetical protein
MRYLQYEYKFQEYFLRMTRRFSSIRQQVNFVLKPPFLSLIFLNEIQCSNLIDSNLDILDGMVDLGNLMNAQITQACGKKFLFVKSGVKLWT